MTPKLLGARIDWLEMPFRVAISDHATSLLRARAAAALRAQCGAAIELAGRAFKMSPPRGPCWRLQNEFVRVAIDPKAPGGEGDEPGWTVRIECSGTAMLALGWSGAFVQAHAIAHALGDVREKGVGRFDLCADVAGYDLRESDRSSYVKQRRVSCDEHWHDGKPVGRKSGIDGRATDGKRVTKKERLGWQTNLLAVGKVGDDDKTAMHWGGDTFEGISFGSGKTIKARIYDKRLELRSKGQPDKTAAECAWWREGGWDGVADVARVEFQVRGEALDELKLRHRVRGEVGPGEHAEAFASSLDPLWAYLTRTWLKLQRRGENVLQPRWREVQRATFVAAADPRARVRKRGFAKAGQCIGTVNGLLAEQDALPSPLPPRIGSTGEVDPIDCNRDEMRAVTALIGKTRTPEEGHAKAKAHVHRIVREVFDVGASHVAAALVARAPTPTDALVALVTRQKAALARASAHRPVVLRQAS